MNKDFGLLLVCLFVSALFASSNAVAGNLNSGSEVTQGEKRVQCGSHKNFIKDLRLDPNGRAEDYECILDPTGKFKKVHKFSIPAECGDVKRSRKSNHIGTHFGSDCSQNSVRSEIFQDVWEDSYIGNIQPKYQWYSWNVYLPESYPIQDGGKLLLGQFHNGECPHISFTSQEHGSQIGRVHFELMELFAGDCRAELKYPVTNIRDLRGKWTNFTLEMQWENNKKGFANIWIDGESVLEYQGRTLTFKKETLNYLKLGIYQCCNWETKKIKPATAYFTSPKMGSTYEDVK